jgi:hypothetical protein
MAGCTFEKWNMWQGHGWELDEWNVVFEKAAAAANE